MTPDDFDLAPTPAILILGVGNILLGDEGIGVRAAEQLRNRADVPSHVRVVDGGTLGPGLMDAVMSCDLLLVLDAVLGPGEPGSLYRLEGDDLRKSLSFGASAHQFDLPDTLILCELAGHRPETVVLGMEPADIRTPRAELSPCCAARLPELVELALQELRGRGLL